ncbi:hypothetical protein [Bacteroides heparinolyticus]|uniref:hypothetical protein n=1 Tax=Prevotella heparinolytica TaxID=28113 RepID=UPI0035A1545C
MKLTTRKGELDLPRDFALTLERTNPLLSDQGDASVPAKLPSSSHNLSVIGHCERIDRAERYVNKIEAFFEVGPVRKRGQLIFDTVHRFKGIDASFAFDNGDLYSKSKNKTLKEIFADHSVEFGDPMMAAEWLQAVFEGETDDYVVFPVAIAPYEVDVNGVKMREYQYNNEVDGGKKIVWESRMVHEGDVTVEVPDCYGLAPFLKLHRLIDLLFRILGYEVAENCLTDWPFKRMVVVHNCSDCLCNPTYTLYYKDLVPSCTLSDFLTWLNNKFHVQAVVDSETKQVQIVSMETMLKMNADTDISGLVEGDFTVQFNPTKRVILTPSNKIEGTEPAAVTFDKLIEKYGDYAIANEIEFRTLESQSPAYMDCLVLRRATGQFYMVEYDPGAHHHVTKMIGTNHFTYDRANSEETEEFSQADILPLMIVGHKMETAPFIGDRLHAHTSYNGSTADDTQEIIVVQAVTSSSFFYTTTGTTQPVIPYAMPEEGKHFYELGLGMCPYDLYDACWSHYNTLLLNHPTYINGSVSYSIGQFFSINMTRMKLCRGQKLMPSSASLQIAQKQTLTDVQFMIVKTFVNGVYDSGILPAIMSVLFWKITDNSAAVAAALWQRILDDFTPNLGVVGVESHDIYYGGFSVCYIGDDLQPGIPQYAGETKTLSRLANITIHVHEVVEFSPDHTPNVLEYNWEETFFNRIVDFTFTAVHP